MRIVIEIDGREIASATTETSGTGVATLAGKPGVTDAGPAREGSKAANSSLPKGLEGNSLIDIAVRAKATDAGPAPPEVSASREPQL